MIKIINPPNTAIGTQSDASVVRTKRKTADESVTSSTTLQSDDHLVIPLDAGKNYTFFGFLTVSGSSACGSKYDFDVPSGASGFFTAMMNRHEGDNIAALNVAIGTGTGTTGYDNGLMILSGYVENPTNAGNLTLRWAQYTSNGTAITLKKNSTLTVVQL